MLKSLPRWLIPSSAGLLFAVGNGIGVKRKIDAGPYEFTKSRLSWKRQHGIQQEHVDQFMEKKIVDQDRLLKSVVGTIVTHLSCEKIMEGQDKMNKFVLFGPPGAGRNLVTKEIAERISADESQPMEICLIKVARDGSYELPRFNTLFYRSLWEDIIGYSTWLLYDLYYERQIMTQRASWQTMVDKYVENVQNENKNDVLWIIDAESTASNAIAKVAGLDTKHFNRVLLNVNAQKIDLNNLGNVAAIRLGDPNDPADIETRLSAIFEEEVLSEKLVDKVGTRLDDLMQLAKIMQHQQVDKRGEDQDNPDKGGTSLDDAIMDFVELKKKELKAQFVTHLDPQVAVWIWDTLQVLCRTAPALTSLSNLPDSTDGEGNQTPGVPVYALPAFNFVGKVRGVESLHALGIAGLPNFSGDVLEVVSHGGREDQEATTRVTARRIVQTAYREICFEDAKDGVSFVESFYQGTVKNVYYLQDLERIRASLVDYFDRREAYDDAFKAVEDWKQKEPDSIEVVHALIDLAGLKRSLDSRRETLLHDFRKLVPSEEENS